MFSNGGIGGQLRNRYLSVLSRVSPYSARFLEALSDPMVNAMISPAPRANPVFETHAPRHAALAGEPAEHPEILVFDCHLSTKIANNDGGTESARTFVHSDDFQLLLKIYLELIILTRRQDLVVPMEVMDNRISFVRMAGIPDVQKHDGPIS